MTRLRDRCRLRPAIAFGRSRNPRAPWGRRRPEIWVLLAVLAPSTACAGSLGEPVGQDSAGDCEIAAFEAPMIESPAAMARGDGRSAGQRQGPGEQMGPLVVLA